MIKIKAPDGSIAQFPDDMPDGEIERVMRETFGGPEAAPQPEDVRDATGVPGGIAEASVPASTQSTLEYLDQTGAVGGRGAQKGLAGMLGLPVDLVNAGLGKIGAPTTDQPFLGSEFFDSLINAPSQAGAALLGGDPDPQPQDALQRVVGRVGQEIGATMAPVGGALTAAGRLGVEGARELGPVARYFVEPAAVAPAKLVGREAAFATAAGTGAGTANEAFGNPQEGDNFWTDFLGSVAGAGLLSSSNAIIGAGKNLAGTVMGGGRYMDDLAGQEIVDRIINSSTDLGDQYARTGQVDTQPLANRLRQPAPVEEAIPGYVANIGDRSQDPSLMTFAQNTDMLSPGAANMRRVGNENAVTARMADMAPQGDPAEFRAALETSRDAQIAEAMGAEETARLIFGEVDQAVQPGMRDATARGSSLRAGLQDAYDATRENVAHLYEPINNATAQIDVAPLRDQFAAVDETLPLNDRARFRPAEADIPAQLVPEDGPATVPLNEITSVRGGLSDDLRQQRASGQRNAARVTQRYQDEVDRFTEGAIPPELREQYDQARAARADQGDRFERPGTGIRETLKPREGGGYQLDDSAVPGRFAQPDSGRVNDTRALLAEAGTDTRVRNALADEVLADVRANGLTERPEALRRYLGERQILLGEFPELRGKLERAGVAREYLTGVEQASSAMQKRLTTPGRSAQASYLKYGDEATVDAVRSLTTGPKPREAARELLEAAGNTPEARVNARAALWEAVKTKKLPAQGATGNDRWDAKKLKAMFDDPKTSAVADELWSDAPDDLADIKNVFNSLAGAEGSVRTRQPGSSGTAQALAGKFDPALSSASVASRVRSVHRGVLSAPVAAIDITATWLRRRSLQVQSRAIDTLASAVVNNPGLAADLLEKYNPVDYAAKRRMITQKYGARVTQLVNLMDEANNEDETVDAVMGDSASNKSTTMADSEILGLVDPGNIDLTKRPVVNNKDGSISTVRSMSFQDDDGKEVLIPTVSPSGVVLTDDGAINLYKRTGKFLGKFDNPDDADAYAETLHKQQEKMYANGR